MLMIDIYNYYFMVMLVGLPKFREVESRVGVVGQ